MFVQMKMKHSLFLIFLCVLFFAILHIRHTCLLPSLDQKGKCDISQVGATNNFICRYELINNDSNWHQELYYRVLYAEEIIFIFISKENEIPEIAREKYQQAKVSYNIETHTYQYIIPFKVVSPKYSLCINGDWNHIYATSVFFPD